MIDLSDEQRRVLRAVMRSDERVQTIGGVAGTGKSTLIAALLAELDGYAACAYTGKAADVLRKMGVSSAATIHRTIYKFEDEEQEMLEDGRKKTRLHFRLRDHVDANGFIIDEASMVDRKIYDDLLSFNKPVIFIGDHGQLEPINGQFNLMRDPDYRLEMVHRNAGEIARFADFVRRGNHPLMWRPESDAVVLLDGPTQEEKDAHLFACDQLICGFNTKRVQVNRYYRRKWLGDADAPPHPGDRIMCLKNDYEHVLFNGQQGHVVDFRLDRNVVSDVYETIVRFDDSTRVVPCTLRTFNKRYPLEHFRDVSDLAVALDYSYAVTCHKMQGAQENRIVVLEQYSPRWSFARWAYTAVSRAKEKVVWMRS